MKNKSYHKNLRSKVSVNEINSLDVSKQTKTVRPMTLKHKKMTVNEEVGLNNLTVSSQDISMGSFESSKIISKDFDKIKKSKLKNTKNRKNSEKIGVSKVQKWADEEDTGKINRSAMVFKSLKMASRPNKAGTPVVEKGTKKKRIESKSEKSIHILPKYEPEPQIKTQKIAKIKSPKISKLEEVDTKLEKNLKNEANSKPEKEKKLTNRTKTTASQEISSQTEYFQNDDFKKFSLAEQNLKIASQKLATSKAAKHEQPSPKSKSIQNIVANPFMEETVENPDYSFDRGSISLRIVSSKQGRNTIEPFDFKKSFLTKKIEHLGHFLDQIQSETKQEKKRFSDLDIQVMRTLRQSFDNSDLKMKTKSRYNFAQTNSELVNEDILVRGRRETWQNNRDSNVLSIMRLVKTYLLGSQSNREPRQSADKLEREDPGSKQESVTLKEKEGLNSKFSGKENRSEKSFLITEQSRLNSENKSEINSNIKYSQSENFETDSGPRSESDFDPDKYNPLNISQNKCPKSDKSQNKLGNKPSLGTPAYQRRRSRNSLINRFNGATDNKNPQIIENIEGTDDTADSN